MRVLGVLYLCLPGLARALDAGDHPQLRRGFASDSRLTAGPVFVKTGEALADATLERIASGNWTGLVNLDFDPETLEVVQAREYGVRHSHMPSWTVFFSGTNDGEGKLRQQRLQDRCSKQGLRCMKLTPKKGSKTHALALEFLVGLRVWGRDPSSDAAIFAEDDTVFIDDFSTELRRSLKQLPKTWQVFWLCPGFLHARLHRRPHSKAFDLKLEGHMMSHPTRSKGGRVYLDWPTGNTDHNRPGILAGGPATGVLRKSAKPLFEDALKAALKKRDTEPVDVIFRDIGIKHQNEHFIAAQPQLCAEERSILGFKPA